VKKFLVLFDTFVKILAYVLMILLVPHMDMHLVAAQTKFRLSFKRTNDNEIPNLLAFFRKSSFTYQQMSQAFILFNRVPTTSELRKPRICVLKFSGVR